MLTKHEGGQAHEDQREKEVALVASGIILGASIAAPVAGAALTAQQSSLIITVDGNTRYCFLSI